MKAIFQYIKAYVQSLALPVATAAIGIMAFFIFCNYYFGWNNAIQNLPGHWTYAVWTALLFLIFLSGYLIQTGFLQTFSKPHTLVAMLLAAALFAWKLSANLHMQWVADARENWFWNLLLQWPIKLIVVCSVLCLIAIYFREENWFGVRNTHFLKTPYLVLLLLMLPLLLWASTQSDFQAMYPKIQKALHYFPNAKWWHILAYELAYGSDFFAIEIFFRGFLVLLFARWFGLGCILPMAMFYCAIHFGKPLAECLSSFFGGIILGVITYHSRSIWGGLMVHLGIAWLMEVFGFIGHLWK